MQEIKVRNTTIRLVQGDITDIEADAIVNAANNTLQHGGGVALAIVKKGGRIIQEESNRIGFVETGKAALTTAGRLHAKYIVHAVGPVMGEGDEDRKLRSAVISSLELAEEKNLKSIAFPAISTGTYRFPKERCAKVMLRAITDYIEKIKPDTSIRLVLLVLFDEPAYRIFERELKAIRKQLRYFATRGFPL
ncbi:MAG: macro domain-containing protein [Candidatus Diapherotrites archaeon]|nr:macro domain-containing protein [Candidatus Diapherotrites archaeon]